MEIQAAITYALNSLTGFELIEAEEHWGLPMERWGGLRTMLSAIHALENRTGKLTWTEVKSMSGDDMNAYFEEMAGDPKFSSPKLNGSPHSSSLPGSTKQSVSP